jgi:hypothetical protein
MPETFTSLIVSHQARLRCIMHRYGFGIMTAPLTNPNKDDEWDAIEDKEPLFPGSRARNLDLGGDSDSDEPIYEDRGEGMVVGGGAAKVGQVASFKNAAIIRLEITNDTVKASLVVSGIIDPKENKAKYTYFVRPDELGTSGAAYKEVAFQDYSTPNIFHHVNDDTYVFYLVRHGQAEHNILKGVRKAFSSKDTSLTPAGIKQAVDSGIKLSKVIKSNPKYKYPDFLFASDLKRTRQTMLNLIKPLPSDAEDKRSTDYKIVVLPCAHELKYKYDPESATCDAKQGALMLPWAKTPNENISTCTRESCPSDGSVNRIRYGLTKSIKYNNDWNSYYDFYSNNTRATRPFFKSCLTCPKQPVGQRCRDTDMITQAIRHIDTEYARMDTGDRDSSLSYDESMRETILPGSERPHIEPYVELGGSRRRKSRKIKAHRVKKTKRARKHVTKKKKHSNKRKGRKTHHKNKK